MLVRHHHSWGASGQRRQGSSVQTLCDLAGIGDIKCCNISCYSFDQGAYDSESIYQSLNLTVAIIVHQCFQKFLP
jgi:hypothetical protein